MLVAEAIGCERVNAWLFNDDGTELRCIEAFDARTGEHTSGMRLREPDFRAEFEVLRQAARYVAADDPLTDPRTAGYVEPYLEPLGITSMLDAVIRVSGRNLGLLCCEFVGRPHRWEQDEIAFACQMGDQIGLVLSIAERRAAEEQLQFVNTVLTTQMETSPDAILVVDAGRQVLSSNARFRRMWGMSASTTEGGDVATVLAAVAVQVADRRAFVACMRDAGSQSGRQIDIEIETVDGRIVEVHSSALKSPSGPLLGRVWFFRDITDRQRAEAEVRHRARHDGLTGLSNRAVFKEAVEQAIARTSRGDRPFALLYLDLDHFKDVNDTLGHPAGDELLRQVADRLRGACRVTDTVARFGGDEFAVIARGVDDPADAARVASALIDALGAPFAVDGSHVRTAASVGIALHASGDADAEALLSQADLALYRAKAEGRGTWRFFTTEMDREVRTRVLLGAELRDAIASGQLFVVYQPQIDLDTGRICGVEALVRWAHPTRGVLLPSVFIPIAEQSGLIRAIGSFVLAESGRQLRTWMDAGVAPARVAVNLSTLQFTAPDDLERDLFRVMDEWRLPANSLELELTETTLMATLREQQDLLVRLRARGFTIAIDDFGTGYSSLDYLRRFRVDRIKIAQPFVQGMADEPSTAAIVRATIGLARELGIAVIAEGVETEAQSRQLRAWGCREAQGFHLSEPLPADAMTDLLMPGQVLVEAGSSDALSR
jgi:diguanylate cyclase (GGDEF)-like protein/PAS domain S-box-containing protein